MSLRIATLFVRHGTEKYADSLDSLREHYRRHLPGVTQELVVVDNALPASHREALGEGATLIGGSNTHWEFSAWDNGVAYLRDRLHGFDAVHLVTSAFRELYNDYIALCDEPLLAVLRDRSIALGHIDHYGEPVRFLGRASQSWIRTSFLFLPPHELALLGSLVSVPDQARFFGEDAAAPFLPGAALDPTYRQHILGWLTGQGTGQGTAWHSRFDLTAETLPRFRAKALAILNEHALSIRLRAQGCAPVDVTWLANQRKAGRPLDIAWPHWSEQVARRFG